MTVKRRRDALIVALYRYLVSIIGIDTRYYQNDSVVDSEPLNRPHIKASYVNNLRLTTHSLHWHIGQCWTIKTASTTSISLSAMCWWCWWRLGRRLELVAAIFTTMRRYFCATWYEFVDNVSLTMLLLRLTERCQTIKTNSVRRGAVF